MKKLMIAAFAVAFAAVAQAATANWSYIGIAADPTGAALTSYTAYLIDSSVVARDTMVAALSAGDTSYLAGAVNTATTAASGTSARVMKSGWGSFDSGTTVNWYTIVLNSADASSATWYMASDAKEFKAPATGSLAASFGNASTLGHTWVEIAPEPTSGLLLLLGMAGLALKRKQA